jgi:hypothetical protein
MPRALGLALLAALLVGAPAAPAPDDPPRALDQVETATVRLVILDAVVVGPDGRPVPDLAREDFEVDAAGEPRAIDTFDVACQDLATERGPGRGARRGASSSPWTTSTSIPICASARSTR